MPIVKQDGDRGRVVQVGEPENEPKKTPTKKKAKK